MRRARERDRSTSSRRATSQIARAVGHQLAEQLGQRRVQLAECRDGPAAAPSSTR